jgi:hypothetical protein
VEIEGVAGSRLLGSWLSEKSLTILAGICIQVNCEVSVMVLELLEIENICKCRTPRVLYKVR